MNKILLSHVGSQAYHIKVVLDLPGTTIEGVVLKDADVVKDLIPDLFAFYRRLYGHFDVRITDE